MPWFTRARRWIIDGNPDVEQGAQIRVALSRMLLQADGARLLLLPAWPRDWKASFRLAAPMNTTVEGQVGLNCTLSALEVFPPVRHLHALVRKLFCRGFAGDLQGFCRGSS